MQTFLSLLILLLIRIGTPLAGTILIGLVMDRISNALSEPGSVRP